MHVRNGRWHTTQCVDTSSNPLACGGCGKACNAGQECKAGACVASTTACGTGQTKCTVGGGGGGGLQGCVDTRTDPLNCGGCGNVCESSQLCVAGSCRSYRPAMGCTSSPCATCASSFGGSTFCPAYGTMKSPICVQGTACP